MPIVQLSTIPLRNRMNINVNLLAFTDLYVLDYGENAKTISEYNDGTTPYFNLAHDFFTSQGFVVRTAASGGGTLLTAGVDYQFVTEITSLSLRVTTAHGGTAYNVYLQLQILNAAYQTGALYISGNWVGDDIVSDDINQGLNLNKRADLNPLNNINLGYRGAASIITTSQNVVAIGTDALKVVTTANSPIGIGYHALFAQKTGNHPIAIGYEALRALVTGSYPIAIGYQALYSATGDSYVIAIGYQALFACTINASENLAIGRQALCQITTGVANTALGNLAGMNLTNGSNCIFIGGNSQPSTATSNNQITLGNASHTSLRCAVTTITAISDMRDKKEIAPLALGADFIKKLKPIQYKKDYRNWYPEKVSDGSKKEESLSIGFLAQDLDALDELKDMQIVNKDNPEQLETCEGKLFPVIVNTLIEIIGRLEKIEGNKMA